MADVEIPAGSHLKWDRLRPMLQAALGEDATRPRMAEFLGVNYLTLWRLTSKTKNGHRYQATEKTVEQILSALPGATYDDLFEEAEERPKNAATRAVEAPERLYTVVEVAQLWSCSDEHIYRLIHEKKLGYKNIGIGTMKIRIPASAITEYLRDPTAKPMATAS